MNFSRSTAWASMLGALLSLIVLAGCASPSAPTESKWAGTWYDILFDSYAEPATREQFRLRADGTGEYFHRPFLQARRWVPIRWQQVAPDKIEFLGMPGNWVASATMKPDGNLAYRVDRGNGSNGLGLFSKNPTQE